MKGIYETLEFYEIQNHLKQYTSSVLGKQLIDQITMIEDKKTLLYELALCNEASSLLFRYGRLPLGGLEDSTSIIHKTMMDGSLYPNELLCVLFIIKVTKDVIDYNQENELETPNFNELVRQLKTIDSLEKIIEKSISLEGEVLDTASSELLRIRRLMKNVQLNIHVKMEELSVQQKEYLSESIVTQRNNRFVLPVKNTNKTMVKGIIHGESSSTKTVFIEPESVVKMNNQLAELKVEEKEEIQRILFNLSQKVKENSETIITNQQCLQKLDFVFSKGAYANATNSVIPTISDSYDKIELYQARHPLIDPQIVVANDIVLHAPKHMLLITGSNTGGKTVTLKTIGLLSMMSLCGLAIPVSKATIPFFDQIFCDLGDEQSIEQSLSTFSSHMKKIVRITQGITQNSLVLMDELGSGTDPKEGESLAQAILEYIHEYHCICVASTHYSALKQFAKSKDYILSSSVEFDVEHLKPTYRLLSGTIGQSYALEISSRLGLNPSIVKKARKIKEESLLNHERLLEKLEKELEQTRFLQDELQQLILDNQQLEKQWIHKNNQLDKEKEVYLQQAKEKANQIIDDATKKVDLILEDLKQKETTIKPHIAIDAKYQLGKSKYVKESTIEKNDTYHPYQIGDRIIVKTLNREGEVVTLPKNDRLTVSLGGLKMQVNVDEIKYIGKPLKNKGKVSTKSIKKVTSGHYELNIIGLRYEEAMNKVDKFLDDALLHHYPHIRIIHGMGTGTLRKGVRKMLEKNKNVVSFRDGGPNEGGLGATLVYFE